MKKKIVSMMLALLMAFGVLGIFCTVPAATVSAAEATADAPEQEVEEYKAIVDAALYTSYESAQDKIDSDVNMRPAAKYSNYELYVNDYTGEIAFKDVVTGQVLLSNPYDVPNYQSIAEDTRKQLLSQIMLGYTNITQNTSHTYYSYEWAAARGQIKVSNCINGILVEYTLGRLDGNYLVPGRITEARMQSEIFSKIFPYFFGEDGEVDPTLYTYGDAGIGSIMSTMYDTTLTGKKQYEAWVMRKIYSYYTLYTPDDLLINPDLKKEYGAVINTYGSIYVIKEEVATARDKATMEKYIKEYCPDYTLEEMLKDHEQTGYVSKDVNPPLFKVALQYTLTEEGLTVRLPANGIRFDNSLYQLDYVTPLQYFGAGNTTQDGYLFYPDGGGAIIDYKDMVAQGSGVLTGSVYGTDYAYHVISGKHQESIRVPVFGLVNDVTTPVLDADGNPVLVDDGTGNLVPVTTNSKTGYLAILEEGDAMANITAAWSTQISNSYTSVYTTFKPRPKDTYDISGDVSSGSTSTQWTVEASRKYTGSYTMRIYMLHDESVKDELQAANRKYFEASYVGMANVYSHYLVNVANVLTAMTEADVTDGKLPLYVEAFGTVSDTKRILSIPVEVDVPLTTFDDIQKMYDDLSGNGITNVHFKLTGFANGGMYSTYPSKLKWMSEVGGKAGFNSLLSDARDNGYGVYPEFDFMYITNTALFDGISVKKAAARTIDNRYANLRVYDATYQEFVSYFDMCVTPVMVDVYYQKFTKAFSKYDPIGISVSTMGNSLNSDFGDKNPTNREDAKKIISGVLEQISSEYGKVMTSGGNAYALQHVNHLLNAALDNSRFTNTSRSVPFVGMVLHGYVNFAGNPINMAGNVDYQVLKAIENGASVYFTLSYDNTDLLKKYEDLSQYYAVNYKIWAGTFDEDGNLVKTGELFEIYNRVNDAIGNLQTKKIVDHDFLIGERIPTAKDLAADDELLVKALNAAESATKDKAKRALIADYRARFADKTITANEVIAELSADADISAVFAKMGVAITTTSSDALDGKNYVSTKYTIADGKLVMVTYEDGTVFILNYSTSDAQVNLNGEIRTVRGYDYVTFKK